MKQCLLGEHTGLRVSELALGLARLGTAKGSETNRAEAHATLHAFADAGGTFVDTSSAYQLGVAEEMLGAFLAEAGRDRFVVATKYGRTNDPSSPAVAVGSHRRAMQVEVEGSLRRLHTDRIELYFPHFDDGVTPVEEIMRGLDDLTRAGKIVHVGLSNFPAWRVASAAQLAELRGWAGVAALQLQYNLAERSIEREHLPMARARGMAVMGWSPLAGGALAKAEPGSALGQIASEHVVAPGAVALAWVRQQGVFPVIGPRSREHLVTTLASLSLTLSAEQMVRLNAESGFARGYPYDLLTQQQQLMGQTSPRTGAVL